ncbi:B12-binding domain-containing radical SAM protein [Tepidibacillus sp. HK-1]|uniref:B12-binding domain-containing radical SAM protein n=1 Tax=Tepidibacillus sp. HK-1 TaxID=1883407 RepID=UPI000853C42C|nr:B12-binding domain-containing radical SAM protein [Tepidibacillus sp. HK-1]GBF12429.1 coproporphyrinogen III oxidase [Tepidibacillus sp. HK-1]
MKIILSTLNAKYIHSSLALRYLKAYSQNEFPEIEILEYSIKEPLLHMVSEIYQKDPDVVGFSCYIWNIEETIQLIQLLKKVKPEVRIVLGGPEVSYDLLYWFERVPEIDVIVVGEGEATFLHLLQALETKRPLDEVLGIAYREGKTYRVNASQPKLDLNEIPSPYQDLEDLQSLKDRIVYFEASRGCPFSCAYCLSSIETGVRYFELERVKEDLLRLIKSGVKLIKFVDRTFNINKKYALEIFQFLIENHQGTVFQFEITADIMKQDVLQYLIDHAPEGILRFEIGVQSTNDYTNSLVHRRQNFKKLSETVLKLKESTKIDQHLDLIAGLPEEDYESFRKTFNDVFELRPEELQLGFLKMLRGTTIWKEAKKYGYIYMDKAPYEILANNVLSFSDVIRIKRVEEVLDKYWNAQRMNRTIEYLIRYEFTSAFDFFQQFGDYWESKGWNRIGHQLETLYTRLNDFLIDTGIQHLEIAQSLMKLDYFLNFNHKPRKTWWEFTLTKKEQKEMMKDLMEDLNLSENELHKHFMIEVVPIDIEAFLTIGEIKEQNTLLAVYYNPPDKPKYFTKKR